MIDPAVAVPVGLREIRRRVLDLFGIEFVIAVHVEGRADGIAATGWRWWRAIPALGRLRMREHPADGGDRHERGGDQGAGAVVACHSRILRTSFFLIARVRGPVSNST
ncbi:MAG: hypothetical protein ACKOFT_09400 [Actinomycetota bacterium]